MGQITDISHHQPCNLINWKQFSKDVDLAIIRVQYGSKVIDREYKKHVAKCKEYGVPFGHYAYGCFISVADARIEARDFLNRIDKEAKFLILDVEDDTIKSCGTKNLAAASQAFIDECKKAGYKVGFYVSHQFYKQYDLNKVVADFLWLPRYGTDNGKPQTKPAYPCDLWQYSQKCKVSWNNYPVDLNLLNGSKPLSYFTSGSIAQSGKEITLTEWMQVKGMDSSYKNREKLAIEYGIKEYEGTSKQNLELFAALREGKPKEDADMQKEFNALKKEFAELKKEVAKKQDKPLAGDIPDPTHAKNWEKATAAGVVNGKRPHEPMTREQFATIYVETLNKK